MNNIWIISNQDIFLFVDSTYYLFLAENCLGWSEKKEKKVKKVNIYGGSCAYK